MIENYDKKLSGRLRVIIAIILILFIFGAVETFKKNYLTTSPSDMLTGKWQISDGWFEFETQTLKFKTDNRFDHIRKNGSVESGRYELTNDSEGKMTFDTVDNASPSVNGFGSLTLKLSYHNRAVKYKIDVSDRQLRLAKVDSTLYGPRGAVLCLDAVTVFQRIQEGR